MDNSAMVNDSDPDELESYFTRYPDVPKESILKQHLLSLGNWLATPRSTPTAGALVVPDVPELPGGEAPGNISNHWNELNAR